MDSDDLRAIVHSSGVDVFTFIDTAIAVASADYGSELKLRRDGIVERLYAATCAPPRCPTCDGDGPIATQPKGVSPATPQSVDNRDDEEEEEEEEEDRSMKSLINSLKLTLKAPLDGYSNSLKH